MLVHSDEEEVTQTNEYSNDSNSRNLMNGDISEEENHIINENIIREEVVIQTKEDITQSSHKYKDNDDDSEADPDFKIEAFNKKSDKRGNRLKNVTQKQRKRKPKFNFGFELQRKPVKRYIPVVRQYPDNCLHCPVKGCEKRFLNSGSLKRHIINSKFHLNLEFDPNLKYKCNDCNFGCDYPKWFSAHTQLYPSHYLKCKLCEQTFTTTTLLNQHQMVSHPIEVEMSKIKCELCDFRCDKLFKMKKHMKRHFGEDLVKCEFCAKNYKKVYIDKHKELVHSIYKSGAPLRTYKCTFEGCDQVFDKIERRYYHAQKVHIKKFKCEWPGCPFVATGRWNLNHHRGTHTGENLTPFACDWPECGFVARSKYNLTHHRYTHTGERPYPCQWPGCDKSFRTEAAFSTHMRLHANDNCYSCEWPGCEFATHDRSHMRTHRMRHQKDLIQSDGQKNTKRLKVVIKSNNNLIKKSINKRNIRKPKRYETSSESSQSVKSESSDYSESE